MGIGEVFMDNTFWQRICHTSGSGHTRLYISGIGWIFVPTAVGTWPYSLGRGLGTGPHQSGGPYGGSSGGRPSAGYMFLVVVWSALLSTAAGSLNALTSLVLNDLIPRYKPKATQVELKRYGMWMTVIFGAIALLLTLPRFLTMLEMPIFLAVINGAFIFPIVFGLFWKRMNTNAAFTAAVVATIVGYYVYYTVGSLQGLVASGWISFLVSIAYSWLQPADFDWEILRHVNIDTTTPGGAK